MLAEFQSYTGKVTTDGTDDMDKEGGLCIRAIRAIRGFKTGGSPREEFNAKARRRGDPKK